MLAEITKIDYPNVTLKKDGKSKEYKVEDFVKKDFIKLGLAEVSFNAETKKISFIKMEQTEEQPRAKSGNKKFTDDLTSFEDLLNKAHQDFECFSIKTDVVSIDHESKSAVFKARIEMMKKSGANQVFEAYGDADQENCAELVKKHYIRMAETRAIARALRWATNNAKAAIEETEEGQVPEEKNQ